ncbi:MAG: phosphoribosylanthranilate isomerase [Halobacteriota archaeon]|nr:phosphoribosylanthranilate isomerase [Halobacteriota archaeon]
MALIKICGITSEGDLDMVLSFEPNALGFIVDVPVDTPRKINSDKAKRLVSKVPIFVSSVLVIMPDGSEEAIEKVEEIRPDVLQIHSDFPVGAIREVKKVSSIPIIKTVGVDDTTDAEAVVNEISDMKGIVDAILLDTKIDQKVGGSGIPHNWSISAKIVERTTTPIILAGGLTPENVAHAISVVHPFAVDTASGLESTPGKKDEQKVEKFILNSLSHK